MNLESKKRTLITSTERAILRLSANSRYEIQVKAYKTFNTQLAGPWSEFLTLKTNESVPRTSPTSVKVVSSTPSSIKVSWGPIPKYGRNGIILGFVVFYREQGSFKWSERDVTLVYSLELTGLTTGKLYSVTVAGYTKIGRGTKSTRKSIIVGVDGGWSSWSTWTSCNQSCGTAGFQERSRGCTEPAPSNGGKTCQGAAWESHGCNAQSCPVHGGWSKWGNWTECSVTCGAGVMSRGRYCDNPVPAYGGRRCEGSNNDSKSCRTGVCIAEVGCYESFPSDRLGSFTDEIDWFAYFSSQMQMIVKKCAHLAVKKRQRFFAVEDFGNCYGARVSPFGSASKATQCNFGVGLKNYYYVYEISS
ncbi:hypothetical protein OS493_032205 [Desmophyllum pertusum]|uniref:Fibronectin type-III domain-containing protein n=1 Tax=Desmophyllum pertusum TaxID=174260 RepID=A0A9W9ZYF6_9CNID|nr:hypothetical protein OS493_032205 [Desmophyllum pertusum]